METDNFTGAVFDDKLSKQENEDILKEKIALLKTYVCMLENIIKASKFKRSQLEKIQSNLKFRCDLRNKITASQNTSNVRLCRKLEVKLCHDISKFIGMPCVKIEENTKLIFEMSNINDIAKRKLYVIEILMDDNGHGKLGQCVLPNFINVSDILLQYPIEDLNNVKYFLKKCKHHIDCYFFRLKQINELKKLFLESTNASIYSNFDISCVELTILGIKNVNSKKYHDVLLFLFYNPDETIPYKLSSTVEDIEIPSSTLIRRLNKYFESFLKMDLISALLEIGQLQNEFIWNMLVK